MTDCSIEELINPDSDRSNDEEQRQLYGNRQHQNKHVNTVDRARCADTLEGLPSEGLDFFSRLAEKKTVILVR